MASLDVEALLDAAATNNGGVSTTTTTTNGEAPNGGTHPSNGHHSGRSSRSRSPRGDRGDRERERDRADRERADRDRDRRRREPRSQSPRGSANGNGNGATPNGHGADDRERTPARSEAGSHRSSRRRSRSPRRRRRNRGHGGGGGGGRSRSRSPNRYYRPRDSRRDRDDRYGGRSPRDRSRDRGGDRYGRDRSRESRRGGGGGRSASPPAIGERDRRTVFVQQLAARLRTRELKEFFEKAGPVAEAQIVKDRVSNRSKGYANNTSVGYVEFKSEDTIAAALQLTGQKLLGIPVIVQVTEAEKNRQVRNTAETPSGGNATGVPFHRLYVGNIHFSITESDLRNVFEPFGELEFVQLQKDDSGRSRGYGFVQFRDSNQAREALEKMNGFDLAGRPIRVGLGNDKFTPESTAHLMQRFQGRDQPHNGNGRDSDRRGGGDRNGSGSGNFDRAGARDNDKGSGAGALDDTDVAGVNFNNYSRDALMRKLARTDDAAVSSASPAAATSTSNEAVEQQRPIMKPRNDTKPLSVGVNVNLASRCVVLHNMFDPAEEEGDDWVKELEDDVRQEAEEKYGHVLHVALDANSGGDIYLKFDKVQGGENAIKGLNGRFFGGRMITAAPVVDAVYSSLFSRSKAM